MIKLEDAIGKFEFSAIPRSLFDGTGIIRTPDDKSNFLTEIESFQNPSVDLHGTSIHEGVQFTVGIIDSMVKVQSMKKGFIRTGQDYGNAFVSLIGR